MRLTWRRVLSSALLVLIGTMPFVACGNETYMEKSVQQRSSVTDNYWDFVACGNETYIYKSAQQRSSVTDRYYACCGLWQ
jgi:hypothetical protein